ncbi:MAG: hypothetical protein AAFR17_00095 [Pseudomonadota bacterium]
MSCAHDCDRPDIFPLDIENRPGLAAFRYRIGTYARMRAHMLDRLVKSDPLQGWSHLSPDEPGIALLEGAALVGDILSFYQQLYANETKLATAAWDDSLRDLVRLTGYRPAPGLAGRTRFALEVEGEGPVTIPAGLPIEAQLDGFDAPALFETDAPATAWEAFNAFHLYRPRKGKAQIGPAMRSLDIALAGGDITLAARSAAAEEIAPGDRILILSGPFDPYEILVVERIEEHLDRVTLHFEGAVQQAHKPEVTAFRLGRSFRHYGSDLPATFTTFQADPPAAQQHQTLFNRSLSFDGPSNDYHTLLTPQQMPLDAEYDDLPTGAQIVCTGRQTFGAADFALVRKIARVGSQTVTWGNASAAVSLLTLNTGLAPSTGAGQSGAGSLQETFQLDGSGPGLTLSASLQEVAAAEKVAAELAQIAAVATIILQQDIRHLRLHETLGPEMLLRAPPVQKPGAPSDGKVNFFGTRAEAEALAGRSLLLEGVTEAPEEVMVSPEQPALESLAPGAPGDHRMWPIQLLQVPQGGAEGFAETDPTITVYGNLVAASEGESQAEAPIGSGDSRLIFQTFAVPKPVSRHADGAATPPWLPALEIRVAGRLWREVETFFDQPAEAEIYILRQDVEGKDAVQFGDGITGARLPSGRGNVTAAWRTGTGARGDLAEAAEPKAKEKLKPLTAVTMPGPATEGADPEGPAQTRAAAPARMQALGRLLVLGDYRAEALALPGVLKADARFGGGAAPAIELTVLTEDESPEAVAAVEASMRHADRCRGPARHVLRVSRGRRRWLGLGLRAGLDPVLREDDVRAAVSDALGALPQGGAWPEGLLALPQRSFGQDVHLSQILAAVQAVEGVVWVEGTASFLLAGLGDDPAEIKLPKAKPLHKRVMVAGDEVLVLSALHLRLETLAVTSDEECPT